MYYCAARRAVRWGLRRRYDGNLPTQRHVWRPQCCLAASTPSTGTKSTLPDLKVLQRRCLGSSSKASSKGAGTGSRRAGVRVGEAVRRRSPPSAARTQPIKDLPPASSKSVTPKVEIASSTSPVRQGKAVPTQWFWSFLVRARGGGARSGSKSSSSNQGERAPKFTVERFMAVARRLPLWAGLAYFGLAYDETAPFAVISVRGPSMLPTMAADQTDLWLVVRYPRLFQSKPFIRPTLAVGDVVGVQVPFRPLYAAEEDNQTHKGTVVSRPVVSCKRVVGVEGDVVKRYGQFAPLLASQDPVGYGIAWPDPVDTPNASGNHHHHHRDLDPSCPWDADQDQRDPHRTLVVPPGHVWVEGDCPGVAVDSRHYGPVPVDAVRGKVVARLWPPWDRPEMNYRDFRRRPHPIQPLDDATLRQYNVHPSITTAAPSGASSVDKGAQLPAK